MVAKQYVDHTLAAASASTTLRVSMRHDLLRQGFGVSGAAYDER